jgi:hypothetical protein
MEEREHTGRLPENVLLGRLSLLLESQARLEFKQESIQALLVAIKDSLRQIADLLERR